MPATLPITAFIGIANPDVMGFALGSLIPDFQINGFVISPFCDPSGRFNYSEKRKGGNRAAFYFVMIDAGF